MRERNAVLVRMRDVGFALASAGLHSEQLSRIQLQKFIYLMDALAVLYKLLPPAEAHYTFRHGPYDPFIQAAVDSLAFRGLAEIRSMQRRSSGSITSEYALSEAGASWVVRLEVSKSFVDRGKLAAAVGANVNRLGWHRLVPLVYAEPTYVADRSNGFGRSLKPFRSSLASSALVLQLIQRSLPDYAVLGGPEVVAAYFFDYLDRYARLQERNGFGGSANE